MLPPPKADNDFLSSTHPGRSTAPHGDVALQAENVTKTYGTGSNMVFALADVSIKLGRGQFTAIMGPSGSGKSTLMHVLAGLEIVSSGRIWLGTKELTGLDDEEMTLLRRRHVGFVFQSFNLVPTLSVEHNILLPFELDRRNLAAQERVWLDHLLRSLNLTARLRHRPHELSGGERQRVAICRALTMRPDVVFADEPTGNLDLRNGREVLSLLRSASREHNQTVAMVTHDALAASRADEVYFLADGRIIDRREGASAEEISALMLSLERRT